MKQTTYLATLPQVNALIEQGFEPASDIIKGPMFPGNAFGGTASVNTGRNSVRMASENDCGTLRQIIDSMVARDGIEPPTPAFSGPPTNGSKWPRISGPD